jgi:hypothetical protein
MIQPIRFANSFLVFAVAAILLAEAAYAQPGGQTGFTFLNHAAPAKLVAMGGAQVTATGRDVYPISMNPGLLTDSLDQMASFSHHFFYAGIQHTHAHYARKLGKKKQLWGFAVQQMGYGTIERFDETGMPLGDFHARDIAVAATRSHRVGVFSLGYSLKFAQSLYDTYAASALLADLGGAFTHPEKDLVVGISFRNLGVALQGYTPGTKPVMPLDILAGVHYKPERMPLRVSLTMHHIHRLLGLDYNDPNDQPRPDAFGQIVTQNTSLFGKISRHFTLGTELFLGKNVQVLGGYSFLHRATLQIEQRKAMAGFSLGLALRLKNIDITYGSAIHHVAGATSSLTLAVNTRSLVKRKKTIQ